MSASQLFGHDASDMFGSVKVMISNLRTMNKLSSMVVAASWWGVVLLTVVPLHRKEWNNG